jgi:hypothetical protein
MLRKTELLSLIVAGCAAGASAGAFAQGTPTISGSTASSPDGQMPAKSRADVKSQTKAAQKSGKLQPPGEAPQPVGDTSRTQHGDKAMSTAGSSTTTRADVRAQTKAERQVGTLQPAGQAPQPVDEPPKK